MPKRTISIATPSDLPQIDLAGRYLEYMRLREIVQEAEQRKPIEKYADDQRAIIKKLTKRPS